MGTLCQILDREDHSCNLKLIPQRQSIQIQLYLEIKINLHISPPMPLTAKSYALPILNYISIWSGM